MIANLTALASAYQLQMSDIQQAQTIYAQVDSMTQKQEMSRWQILQDTQTKIFEMQQETTVQRAKTQDKMFDKWNEYIKA